MADDTFLVVRDPLDPHSPFSYIDRIKKEMQRYD
jgi:hypothetical protein